MLHCRDCGQNKYISEDNFIAYRNISGSETVYVSCEDPYDILDYGDSDTDSDGIENWQCPHCDGQNIDTDWDGTQDERDEALGLRNSYIVKMEALSAKRKNERQAKERWDE